MLVKYLGGHQYCVTFIDDFSRKNWLYLLKKKGEVFQNFQVFKNEVENITERKNKNLSSDNDGEYTSKELISFYKEAGVKGSLLFPIILNIMAWMKEIIQLLKNVLGPCYMIKISFKSYGERHV